MFSPKVFNWREGIFGWALVLFAILPQLSQAQNIEVLTHDNSPSSATVVAKTPNGAAIPSLLPYTFPSVYFTNNISNIFMKETSRPYGVETKSQAIAREAALKDSGSMLLNEDILAFYGHPGSRNMGILGRYSIPELDAKLTKLAEEYEKIGHRKVQRAFYLIYGTVWPGGNIGLLPDKTVREYIKYGLKHNILIFLDHQIGRYDPVESLEKMLPYLRYPNVHLALDPEWRTTKPMEEIGSISAAELNNAQRVMENYIIRHHISGERFLVIHQFNWCMIRNRSQVRTGLGQVRLIHCADGFGTPLLKRQSYAFNAAAKNMPFKGFKLFYNFGIPGAGYDKPLFTPAQVYALNPRPCLIIYQ
jgi:hypothetical protein